MSTTERIHDASEARGTLTRKLAELSQLVNASPDTPPVLDAIARAAVDLLGADRVGVWVVDEASGLIRLAAEASGGAPTGVPGPTQLPRGCGTVGWVIEHKAWWTAAYPPDDPAFPSRWASAGGHAFLACVPVLAGECVLGALAVTTRTERPTVEDHALLVLLAANAATALERARRSREARREVDEPSVLQGLRQRLTALLDVTQRLTRDLDPRALLATIAGAAAEVFDGEAGFRVAEGTELVRVGATPGALAIMSTERLRLGESLSGRVATTGEAIVTSDLWSDDRVIEAHRQPAQRLGALMCLPVRAGTEVLGTLNIYRRAGHVFDAEEVALATSFAHQAAIAIENARLFARTEARRREAEAIADVGHVLAETLDPDVVGQRIVESVSGLLGARSAALYSLHPESATLAAITTYGAAPEDVPPRFVFSAGMGVVGRVVEDGRPFTCTNLLTDPRIVHPPDSRLRIQALTYRAALGVPLQVRGRVIGALFVGDVEGRVFTDQDARLAETFADQAALALEGARLHRETERTLAELRTKNAELDTFVYSVSHDLKSPLVSAQGMAGALLEDCGDALGPEGRHYVARLQANVQHMERLIQDLTALSRIGRESRTPEAVELAEVVDECLADLAEPIRARGVRVSVGALPAVWGVRTHVEQVIGNLLANAVKYLGETATPTIEVGGEVQEAVVACFVRDNGIGINPAYHAKVFEIFQRLGDVSAEGTGVGLAIVRKIVEGAGGRVWVESAKGAGATFRFTWPASPRAMHEAPSFRPDALANAVAAPTV